MLLMGESKVLDLNINKSFQTIFLLQILFLELWFNKVEPESFSDWSFPLLHVRLRQSKGKRTMKQMGCVGPHWLQWWKTLKILILLVSNEGYRRGPTGKSRNKRKRPGARQHRFTESFVNICRFGLNFRFMDEPRPLELNLAVLQPALRGMASSAPYLTWLSSFTPCCHSLLILSFYCISWRGNYPYLEPF